MLKKIYLSLGLLVIILWPNSSQAFSKTELIDRYSGSIMLADSGFNQQYWYLEPNSQVRYAVDTNEQLNNLINKFSTNIKTQDLAKIPTNENKKSADYNLVKKYRGQFLTIKQKNGQEIWYVHPLDLSRYLLPNDDSKLNFIQTLAIDINAEKLDYLPLADLEQFNVNTQVNFDEYWQIYNKLKTSYLRADTIDNNKLFQGSLSGLVNALGDPYTQFFTPQNKKQFDDTLAGTTEGIGAMVDIKDNKLTITTPLDNMPAAKAGLLPYDQILMANDQDLANMSLDEAISFVKGPAGSTVKLKIYRPSTQKTFEVNVTRAKIVVPNVSGKRLDNGITYIKINSFAANLPGDFNRLKSELVDQNTKSLIIDLRNNPGGYTDAAVFLAEQWLDSGQVIFKEKFPKSLDEYLATTPIEIKLPTVVLVNSGSASAAEIFTAALKNHAKAKIVGETTFGKGTGQAIQTFPDGSALKYTIFEWLDPANNSIEKTGVKPDLEVTTKPGDQFDNQLYQAIQLLNK